MTSERTNKILVALVIVLAAMNIATLGTIAYGYLNKQKATRPNSQIERPMQRDKAEKLMVKELNLSKEQTSEFRALRNEYRQDATSIMQQIKLINKEIFDELSSDTPRESYLLDKADQVGLLYGEHRTLTIKHMLKVRQICSPEQCKHLPMFFRNMNPDQGPMHQGRMRRNRR